ncbi:uncharacterized protein EMH_0013260 [Eimeria mitis]|uniref:Uncharacterized protein n=1 Tax=Eimeria mitis TaxID=44415 RepID=U6K8X7_9EIME|nr:uncharacterized protein EMH_0013260 [Eimeria mitis]CDJ32672.1 hypothetical protein EMH_0013260 [Eimeria mitis]
MPHQACISFLACDVKRTGLFTVLFGGTVVFEIKVWAVVLSSGWPRRQVSERMLQNLVNIARILESRFVEWAQMLNGNTGARAVTHTINFVTDVDGVRVGHVYMRFDGTLVTADRGFP